MVTCQQFGRHIWTDVQISVSNFHHRGYNSFSWTKFSSPQENQDPPLLHCKLRQILSTLTVFNREGLSCTAEETSQHERCGHWKIYIIQQFCEISFKMTKLCQLRYLDLISVFCRLWLFVIAFTFTFSFFVVTIITVVTVVTVSSAG